MGTSKKDHHIIETAKGTILSAGPEEYHHHCGIRNVQRAELSEVAEQRRDGPSELIRVEVPKMAAIMKSIGMETQSD